MINKFLDLFEKYGLLIVFLNIWQLLLPDFSAKQNLTDLEINIALDQRSGSNLGKQLSWILPFFVYILCVFRSQSIKVFDKNLIILTLSFFTIFLLCFISIFWSDFPNLTAKRSFFQFIMMMVLTLSVFFSTKHDTFPRCVNTLFYLIVFSCLLSIALGTGFQNNNLLGWAKSKNVFGVLMLSMVMLISIAQNYYRDEISYFLPKIVIIIFFLVLSGSKTSIALTVLLLLSSRLPIQPSRISLYFSFATLVGIFILIPLLSSFLGNYWDISFMLEDETLTGRGIIWNTLYYGLESSKNLTFGHGYGAYFNTGLIPEALDDTWSYIRLLNSAHNGYLELLLQIGVLISLASLLIILKLVLATQSAFCITSTTIIFIYNITESAMLRDQNITWAMIIIIISFGFFARDHLSKTHEID